MRKIVCTAVRAEDGTFIVGIRHYSQDMVDQIHHRPDGEKFKRRQGNDQGFVDNRGVYLTRREAFVVAVQAGQCDNITVNHTVAITGEWSIDSQQELPELFSEMLY